MTINEAYNKGLDDAEAEALDKFEKAIHHIDSEPFANPKMEEFRQKLLSISTVFNDSPDVESVNATDEEYLSVEYIRNILLLQRDHVNEYKPYSQSTFKVISALKNLMSFISVRAEKNNNGSKNYLTMLYDIKSILTK